LDKQDVASDRESRRQRRATRPVVGTSGFVAARNKARRGGAVLASATQSRRDLEKHEREVGRQKRLYLLLLILSDGILLFAASPPAVGGARRVVCPDRRGDRHKVLGPLGVNLSVNVVFIVRNRSVCY
jgi:hypothetical protein